MKTYLISGLLLICCLRGYGQDYASRDFSNKVIRSFAQGDNARFNCAAISLVKCAIATYGIDGVLRKIEPIAGGFDITLRNGESVNLSNAELAFAKSKCGFKLMSAEAIFDKSILLYAILAKRGVNNSDPLFSECKDLSTTLTVLKERNKAISVIHLVPLLGFNLIEVRPFSEISYIHQTGHGAVFACYKAYDDKGSTHRFSKHLQRAGPDFILANFTTI